jgi:hypothetical protein
MGHLLGRVGELLWGQFPQIPQEVPPDAPVGQKRDRTFSDDFVKEYMDLDRFVDVLGLLRKDYW